MLASRAPGQLAGTHVDSLGGFEEMATEAIGDWRPTRESRLSALHHRTISKAVEEPRSFCLPITVCVWHFSRIAR